MTSIDFSPLFRTAIKEALEAEQVDGCPRWCAHPRQRRRDADHQGDCRGRPHRAPTRPVQLVDEERAIGISVEGDAEIRSVLLYGFDQCF